MMLIIYIRNGDIVEIDIAKREINVQVDAAEMEKRRQEWKPPLSKLEGTGYLSKFVKLVSTASEGCITTD